MDMDMYVDNELFGYTIIMSDSVVGEDPKKTKNTVESTQSVM